MSEETREVIIKGTINREAFNGSSYRFNVEIIGMKHLMGGAISLRVKGSLDDIKKAIKGKGRMA